MQEGQPRGGHVSSLNLYKVRPTCFPLVSSGSFEFLLGLGLYFFFPPWNLSLACPCLCRPWSVVKMVSPMMQMVASEVFIFLSLLANSFFQWWAAISDLSSEMPTSCVKLYPYINRFDPENPSPISEKTITFYSTRQKHDQWWFFSNGTWKLSNFKNS